MTADNRLKTHLGASLNAFAEAKVQAALQRTGKSLPCQVVSVNGAIVTVKFEVQSEFTLPQVTVPVMTSVYVREPLQPGDQGFVVAADAYLGGVSGLGGGIAGLTPMANLTALAFQPLGSMSWASVNSGQVTVQGPGGALIQDMTGSTMINLSPGTITLSAGGHTLTVSSAGIQLDGKVFATHEHTGVSTGASNTGTVA